MTAGLEHILSVDEECRSRVAFAEKQIARAIAEARAERDRAIESRANAAAAALQAELDAIREEGEKRIAERRTALAGYLDRLAAAGEQNLEAAARLYAAIIRGETEGEPQ